MTFFDIARELEEISPEDGAKIAVALARKRDPIEERITLAIQKKECEQLIDEINERLAELDEQIIAEWMETETQNVKRMGQTLYLARREWAVLNKEVDKDEVISALRQAGAGHTITVNSTSLTAWMKEQNERGGVPDTLDGKVQMVERVGLRMKKA